MNIIITKYFAYQNYYPLETGLQVNEHKTSELGMHAQFSSRGLVMVSKYTAVYVTFRRVAKGGVGGGGEGGLPPARLK